MNLYQTVTQDNPAWKALVIQKGAYATAMDMIVLFARAQSMLAKYSRDKECERKSIIRLHGDLALALREIEVMFDITEDEKLEGHTLANMALVEELQELEEKEGY
jgi:hypothetical protein